jgi:agmatinase
VAGIATLPPVSFGKLSPQQAMDKIEAAVTKLIDDKKVPLILGGEHSISPAAVKAFAKKYKGLSVLQFDAHADLRDTFKENKLSHACATRRILEICPDVVQVGIRSISRKEIAFAKKSGQIENIHWAEKLEITDKVLDQLTENVYITFDIDALDPSLMPSTGTPEPGGLDWYEALDILKAVCAKKNVVGFDLVELAPIKGLESPNYIAARLAYKMISYKVAGKNFRRTS